MAGKLYLIPTPVGNLEDITLRALRLLKEVDLILAEDTRTSAKLLKHYDITTPLLSHHKFNEHQQVDRIAQRIEEGENIALISDAGTPGISDPGFLLTRTCLERNLPTECLPGATAFVPALVNSGFPCALPLYSFKNLSASLSISSTTFKSSSNANLISSLPK